MGSIENDITLFKDLKIDFVKRGGVLLITTSDFEPSIKKLVKAGITILGFDAFKIDKDSIQPFMKYSEDYSKGQPELSEILEVKNKIPKELTHFEIVIDHKYT